MTVYELSIWASRLLTNRNDIDVAKESTVEISGDSIVVVIGNETYFLTIDGESKLDPIDKRKKKN